MKPKSISVSEGITLICDLMFRVSEKMGGEGGGQEDEQEDKEKKRDSVLHVYFAIVEKGGREKRGRERQGKEERRKPMMGRERQRQKQRDRDRRKRRLWRSKDNSMQSVDCFCLYLGSRDQLRSLGLCNMSHYLWILKLFFLT